MQTPAISNLRNLFWAGCVLLVIFASIQLVNGKSPTLPVIAGTAIANPKPISAFKLQNDRGQPYNNNNLLGKWSVLFFGYTSCTDTCPTTLVTINQSWQQLRKTIGQPPQLIFVTVDPLKDSPEKLHSYLQSFNSNFIGLTGQDKKLRSLAKNLGINYGKQHTNALLLVNPQAKVVAYLTAPYNSKQIATQITSLEQYYQHS